MKEHEQSLFRLHSFSLSNALQESIVVRSLQGWEEKGRKSGKKQEIPQTSNVDLQGVFLLSPICVQENVST